MRTSPSDGDGPGASTAERPFAARRFGTPRHVLLSCFWFAYNFHWVALLAIVLPSQIAAIVGDGRKELFNGIIPPLGAALSLILTPVAGALSDRSASRFGRRRPFMIWGTVVNIAFLLWVGGMGAGASVGLFVIGYLGVQLGSNWSGGPYAGLIPDLVPKPERGRASGWLALMTALGMLIGALVAGRLVRDGEYQAIYAAIAVVLGVFLLITVIGVRERPAAPIERGRRAAFWSTFIPRGSAYRDFYYVLLTRALVSMGIFSVFTFFQFFLQDIVRVPDAVESSSHLVAVIIATGVPTSLAAGALSDRVGRKPLIYWSGGLMAVASLVYIAVGFAPSFAFMLWVGGVFGIGYGAYQAVDWALAVDVLPRGDAAAKDMGVWHVSLVLPQVVAPAVTGLILTALKPTSLLLGYAVVFVLTALWFVLGTLYVRRVRGAR